MAVTLAMQREIFGGVQIFRSHPHTVHFFRSAVRAHLLREFHVGSYSDWDIANRILQHQFDFFSKSLTALVPKLVTRDALEFVLFQYDQAGKILHAKGIKHPLEVERWLGIEGNFRRALKYLPYEVGEIDYLGFHPKERLLVIAEAKMSNVGLEGKLWRDDVEDFVRRRNSYAEKFRRKIAWVAACRNEIGIALTGAAVERFAAVMVTLYPCIARMFITDFPCVSITELMLDYRAKGKWPYQTA